MAGRFEGLSDLEWKLFEDVITEVGEKRGRGMPHAPLRHVLNTLMYVLITGCRPCDVPNSCNLGIKKFSPQVAQKLASRWNVGFITGTDTRNRIRERIN